MSENHRARRSLVSRSANPRPLNFSCVFHIASIDPKASIRILVHAMLVTRMLKLPSTFPKDLSLEHVTTYRQHEPELAVSRPASDIRHVRKRDLDCSAPRGNGQDASPHLAEEQVARWHVPIRDPPKHHAPILFCRQTDGDLEANRVFMHHIVADRTTLFPLCLARRPTASPGALPQRRRAWRRHHAQAMGAPEDRQWRFHHG